jgi:hypothetical protein
MDGHRTNAFVVIDNFTNLLNDEWGILREASFPRRVSVVNSGLTSNDTQFAYTNFRPETNSGPVVRQRVALGRSAVGVQLRVLRPRNAESKHWIKDRGGVARPPLFFYACKASSPRCVRRNRHRRWASAKPTLTASWHGKRSWSALSLPPSRDVSS